MASIPTTSVSSCPSDERLLAFHRAQLDKENMDRVHTHIESCTDCILFLDQQDENSDTIVQWLASASATTDDEAEFQQLQARLLNEPESIESTISAETITEMDRARHDPNRLIGQCIGKYRLIELLGRGASGTVYKAWHEQLDRPFVLKLLMPRSKHAGSSVQQFRDEMKAVGRLNHPNVIKATDAGQHEGRHYLVMEYVDGVDTSCLVRQVGPLRLTDAAEIVRQAALGLHAAHSQSMVHRDVKPSNLFFGFDGVVRILDLGLALTKERDGFVRGAARGTADYMAPEQWQNCADVDSTADIYGLGCTLFKLLTGHAPFAPVPNDYQSKMHAHQFADIPRISCPDDDTPLGMSRIIQKMLAKKSEERFSSMLDVAKSLEPYAVDADLSSIVATYQGKEAQPRQIDSTPKKDKRVLRRTVMAAALTGTVSLFIYSRKTGNTSSLRTNQWRNLAIPSTKSIISGAKVRAKLDAQQRLELDADEHAIHLIGNPIHGTFCFEAQVDAMSEIVRAGIMFRFRRSKRRIGLRYEFQTLQIVRDRSAARLIWNDYLWDYSRKESRFQENPIAETMIGDVDSGIIGVSLGQLGFPDISFQGTLIPQREWQISHRGFEAMQLARVEARKAYLGEIGFFVSESAACFSKPRLKYLA